jgi:hypothetical protein
MILPWFNVAGLVLDIVGASVQAWSFVSLTEAEEFEQGQTVRGAAPSVPRNLELARIRGLLQDAMLARWGWGLLVAGFVLQLIGSWPKAVR